MNNEKKTWLEQRRLGIGSSDAPIILGLSPWSTPYKLWCEKLSTEIPEDNGNWATARGNNLEPLARSLYEEKVGKLFPAKNVVHSEYDFLRASLDGYNEEENIVLEIKCPGAADHLLAVEGGVPLKYIPQLQHQLMVTGAKECHYVSYDGAQSLALVVVQPNPEYAAELLVAEQAFWKLVQDGTPPPLTDGDVKVIDHLGLMDLANKYIELDLEAKAIEVEMKKIKELILEAEEIDSHPKFLIGRLNITRSFRAGAIDYGAVPQLAGVDLDWYRKKGTSSVTFTIKKEAK